MEDKLDGVSVFVQVAESGSFALAAERLDLTRSAVGKAIARLEARLGARLLHRTTRSQGLTEAGQVYYERCVRALAELEAAQADLDCGRSTPRGRLRVSVPLAFGHQCVMPVLLELGHRHAQLQIDVSFSDRIVDVVEEGYDLAVRIGPLRDSTSLAARRLGVQHAGIGAAPSYLARHGTPATAEEMDGHAGIVYAHAGVVSPWELRAADGKVRRIHIRPRLSLDDLQAIVAAAVDGFGLAWLPSWLLARHTRRGELVALMDQCRLPPQDIHVVWPQSRHLPLKTRVAIDALVAGVPALLAG